MWGLWNFIGNMLFVQAVNLAYENSIVMFTFSCDHSISLLIELEDIMYVSDILKKKGTGRL